MDRECPNNPSGQLGLNIEFFGHRWQGANNIGEFSTKKFQNLQRWKEKESRATWVIDIRQTNELLKNLINLIKENENQQSGLEGYVLYCQTP